MRRIYPACEPAELDELYEDVLAADGDPYVMMNMVVTVDGRAAVNERSSGIGSDTDHRLMRRLRSLADAVLTGSGTLAKEGVGPGVPRELEESRTSRGLSPQPLTVLFGGGSGVRLRGKLATLGPRQLLIYLPRSAESADLAAQATVYVGGAERVDPVEAVWTLHELHGVRRLLVEGGPRVANSFLRAGLIDEIYCTIAPKAAGGGDAPTMFDGEPLDGTPRALELRSVHEESGELYLRYGVVSRVQSP